MPWRRLVPKLLTSGSFRTQGELVRALEDQGHEVNQATVSRELASLGVRKVDGVYRLPASPLVGAPVHRVATTANGCLVVVTTEPAFATIIALAIDAESLDGVLGTIAGDDTVFVATAGKAASRRLTTFLATPNVTPSSRAEADPTR